MRAELRGSRTPAANQRTVRVNVRPSPHCEPKCSALKNRATEEQLHHQQQEAERHLVASGRTCGTQP